MKTTRRNLLKLLAATPFAGVATQIFGKAETGALSPPEVSITPVGPRTVTLPVAAHPDAGKCYLLQNTFWLDTAEHFHPNDVVSLIKLRNGVFVGTVFIEIIKPNRGTLLVNVGCEDYQGFYLPKIDLGAPAGTIYSGLEPSEIPQSIFGLTGGRLILDDETIDVTFLEQPTELAFNITAICMQF